MLVVVLIDAQDLAFESTIEDGVVSDGATARRISVDVFVVAHGDGRGIHPLPLSKNVVLVLDYDALYGELVV